MAVDHRDKAFNVAIDKLHKYRSALISAAVTGKIDVRGYLSQETGGG